MAYDPYAEFTSMPPKDDGVGLLALQVAADGRCSQFASGALNTVDGALQFPTAYSASFEDDEETT